jgi:hypothetical protein
MKNFLFAIIAFVFLSVNVFAMDWTTANQVTIGWDAVTTLADGTPIPETDVIMYEIFVLNTNVSTDKNTAISLGEIAETERLITFANEGKYLFGAKTVRYDSEGNLLMESTIAWSDDTLYAANGNSFGVVYYIAPSNPTGIRLK